MKIIKKLKKVIISAFVAAVTVSLAGSVAFAADGVGIWDRTRNTRTSPPNIVMKKLTTPGKYVVRENATKVGDITTLGADRWEYTNVDGKKYTVVKESEAKYVLYGFCSMRRKVVSLQILEKSGHEWAITHDDRTQRVTEDKTMFQLIDGTYLIWKIRGYGVPEDLVKVMIVLNGYGF